ncbi:antitoxin [Allobranchiibius sp. GilTou73]|uniref:antitoxin n=1 Tax=Allobranchiibius sp. GilTou73 TaxID=2904523 RepID=UPI001F209C0D|nr:antitoxin [Allobranchiibius sp. GilTou73]UIJ33392.1 antitoxin [Allobranchiibius sp. GilTou73]
MGLFDSAKDKASDFANDNPDKLKEGVEKGGDFVDDKTGGKYSDQVDKGQDAVSERFGGGQGGDDAGDGDQNQN